MKDILAAALCTKLTEIKEENSDILAVKLKNITVSEFKAFFWVISYNEEENVHFITKAFLNLGTLEAGFTEEVVCSGTYEKMLKKLKRI